MGKLSDIRFQDSALGGLADVGWFFILAEMVGLGSYISTLDGFE